MKRKIRVFSSLLIVLVLLFQTACSKPTNTSGNTNSDSSVTTVSNTPTVAIATKTPTEQLSISSKPQSNKKSASKAKKQAEIILKPYDDIRDVTGKSIFEENEYRVEDIITFNFNKGTVLKGNEKLQEEVMENGKNPGLGIRKLHKEGLMGKGINVAIIDQNLLLHHPEFDGKIAGYYDTGCEQNPNSGSMHAPAVTSILVGNKIGVAPDAKVYFAAAPSWKGDSEYYAKGLYWIIDENKKLPEGEKIRVVSVSAAPSGEGSFFTKNTIMWDEAVLAAQEEGILVLDCRSDKTTGIIAPAYYDTENPEDVALCKGGYPAYKYVVPSTHVGVPTSFRTVAEEYWEGTPSYQYTGRGGLSWGIPYAAGVLALGWQVNPALDNDQIIQTLFETCAVSNDGSNIIDPTAFIEAVKKTKK